MLLFVKSKEKKNSFGAVRIIAIIHFFIALSLDTVTKKAAISHLNPDTTLSLFLGILQFHLVENHNGFLGYYGFLPGNLKDTLLTWGTGILILLLFCSLLRSKEFDTLHQTAIALILAGGVGNLADRLFNEGGVIDFILLTIGPLQTGIFNLADIFILIGSVYLGATLAKTSR